MPNLNPPHLRGNGKLPFAPGVFQKDGQSITVTTQAAVESLIANGWARTAD